MTTQVRSEEEALTIASREHLCYGINPADGRYYVGTSLELEDMHAIMVCCNPEVREST